MTKPKDFAKQSTPPWIERAIMGGICTEREMILLNYTRSYSSPYNL